MDEKVLENLKVAGINNMSSNVNPSMTTLSAINDIELMP